jgi:hypothetical protein
LGKRALIFWRAGEVAGWFSGENRRHTKEKKVDKILKKE